MKKKLTLGLLLLLCFALSATACSFSSTNIPVYSAPASGNTADAPLNDQNRIPADPIAIVGKWYSGENASVLQFFSAGTVKMYILAPGYYEYTSVKTGTYTYDGQNIVLSFSGEDDLRMDCSVENDRMTLSSSAYQSLQYQYTEEKPAEHPTYTFPDFETLAQKYALPEGSFTGNTVSSAKIYEEAFNTVKEQYLNQKSNDALVKNTSGTAKTGDFVNIDFTGYLNGLAFDNGSAKNQQLVVSSDSGYIPGFAEAVAGHAVGETFDVNLTFPENYGNYLAGKSVVFTMTLNSIDDLTQWIGQVYEDLLKEEIWTLLPALANAEIPEEAYQFFYQYNIDLFHNYAFQYGMDYEIFMSYANLSEADIRKDCIEIARKYMQAAQLVKEWNLTPGDELTNRIREEFISDYMSAGLSREDAEKLLDGDGRLEFRAYLLTELATDYLLANNTFVSDAQ